MSGLFTPGGLEISIATSEAERNQCFELRYRVYVEEQGRRPPGADHDRRFDQNADDATGILFLARIRGEAAATLRLHHGGVTGIPPFVADACDLPHLQEEVPAAEIAAISRLAIEAPHRGGMVTVALFRHCFEFLKADGRRTSRVLILAFDEPRLIAMYRMLGFRPLAADRRYETDLGTTLPMVAAVT